MAFHIDDAPHLAEYLSLIGNPQPETLSDPIGPDVALVIIDMQCDFLLKDVVTNPHGGRFGSSEGDQCVAPIAALIEHFVRSGGYAIAARDYRPHDHTSFFTQGGPYPPHCVQGTIGSQLAPEISEALTAGVKRAHITKSPTPAPTQLRSFRGGASRSEPERAGAAGSIPLQLAPAWSERSC